MFTTGWERSERYQLVLHNVLGFLLETEVEVSLIF